MAKAFKNMKHPVWSTEAEYLEFLRLLERMCGAAAHKVVAPGGSLRFAFSALRTPIGLVDVFRFQRKDAWDSDQPMSAAFGQGMFKYEGSNIQASDICDSGYKYVLPDPTPQLYTVKTAPPLLEIVNAVHSASNVSNNYSWEGP